MIEPGREHRHDRGALVPRFRFPVKPAAVQRPSFGRGDRHSTLVGAALGVTLLVFPPQLR